MLSRQALQPMATKGAARPKVGSVFGSRCPSRSFCRHKPAVARAQRRHEQQERIEVGLGGALAVQALAMASMLAALPAHAEALEATAAPGAAAPAPELVDSAVSTVIDAVKAAGSAVKSGLDLVGVGLGYAMNAYDQAAPVVKDVADTATPYVKKGLEVAGEVAAPVVKAAEPVVKAGVGEVESFLAGQGLNARVIVEGAQKAGGSASEALEQARPALDSTVSTLSSTSPTLIAEYVAGALALYYLGPGVLKAIFGGLRGYAGDISPAGALDAVTNDGNTLIIDIRTEREKESAGIPDIPNSGRLIELEYASISDRKIRGQLRNPSEIEKTVTVLSIAALKKVGRGTRILLLDRNGGLSKAVAKDLDKKGFKKVFVISGGFNGWTSSKLQTKYSSSVSAVEVLSPVFGTVRSSATQRTNNRQGGRLSLPSGR